MFRAKLSCQALSVFAAMALLASPAAAYVDPGIVATLYQLVYVLIFGALSALVFKPVRLIKSSLRRLRERYKRSETV